MATWLGLPNTLGFGDAYGEVSVVPEEHSGRFFVRGALVPGSGVDVVAADVPSVGTDRADLAFGVVVGFDVGFCQVGGFEGIEAVLGEQVLFQAVFAGSGPCGVGGAVDGHRHDGLLVSVRDAGGEEFAL